MKISKRIAYGKCYKENGDLVELRICVTVKTYMYPGSAPAMIEYIRKEPIYIELPGGFYETLKPEDEGYKNAVRQAEEYFREEGLMI